MREIDAGMAVEFRAPPDAVRRQAHVPAVPMADLAPRLAGDAPLADRRGTNVDRSRHPPKVTRPR